MNVVDLYLTYPQHMFSVENKKKSKPFINSHTTPCWDSFQAKFFLPQNFREQHCRYNEGPLLYVKYILSSLYLV